MHSVSQEHFVDMFIFFIDVSSELWDLSGLVRWGGGVVFSDI